jgi:hypothetical protein
MRVIIIVASLKQYCFKANKYFFGAKNYNEDTQQGVWGLPQSRSGMGPPAKPATQSSSFFHQNTKKLLHGYHHMYRLKKQFSSSVVSKRE